MMSSIDRIGNQKVLVGAFTLLCFVSTMGILHGCSAPTQYTKSSPSAQAQTAQFASKPAELRSSFCRLSAEGERNRVLNLMRLGTDAIKIGDLEEARNAFDGALLGIERVYANCEEAHKARSLWVEEGRKIFKGEPYERVMAYYYRSLLYIWEGDYQNARACCKGGILQDAFAEEDQHRCDFALLLYLSGWCSQQLDDTVLRDAAFEEVKTLRPRIVYPGEKDNLLFLIETGKSPRKVSDGVGHYQLKFRRGKKFTENTARVHIDDSSCNDASTVEDVFFQASTRGGRQVDCILQGKAQFRRQTQQVGSGLGDLAAGTMTTSTLFSNSASELQGVGAGLGLISVVSQVAAAKARTEADTRYWDNLPDRVHVFPCQLDSGTHEITVEFLDQDSVVIPELTTSVTVEMSETGSKVVWIRSQGQHHHVP